MNAAATTKIIGTAQRLTRHGYLFSAVVLVPDPEPVRAVLVAAYAALGLEWRPGTVGAVAAAELLQRLNPGQYVARCSERPELCRYQTDASASA